MANHSGALLSLCGHPLRRPPVCQELPLNKPALVLPWNSFFHLGDMNLAVWHLAGCELQLSSIVNRTHLPAVYTDLPITPQTQWPHLVISASTEPSRDQQGPAVSQEGCPVPHQACCTVREPGLWAPVCPEPCLWNGALSLCADTACYRDLACCGLMQSHKHKTAAEFSSLFPDVPTI